MNSGSSSKTWDSVTGNISWAPTATKDEEEDPVVGEGYSVQFILSVGPDNMNGEHKTVHFSAFDDTSGGSLELLAGDITDFGEENGSVTLRLYPREGYKINRINGYLKIDKRYQTTADLDVNGTQIQLGLFDASTTITEPIQLIYEGDGVGWDYYDFACTWNT